MRPCRNMGAISECILKINFSLCFDRIWRPVMKILIKIGFLIWRKRHHCGCRQIVDSRRHKIRRRMAYHAAMVIRAALIMSGY